MNPPNFRITKVKCCYTCIHSEHGEVLSCKYHYGYIYKRRTHYGMSMIGICDKFKQRKKIGEAANVSCGDNISYPEKI